MGDEIQVEIDTKKVTTEKIVTTVRKSRRQRISEGMKEYWRRRKIAEAEKRAEKAEKKAARLAKKLKEAKK